MAMKKSSTEFITESWYKGAWWLYFLLPLAWLYHLLISLRRLLYTLNISKSYRPSIPVIVVGNITLGGTGKSPLVAYLVESLRQKGYHPGVVSRGYGSSIGKEEVKEVLSSSLVSEVGDEPLMLKRRVNCPVFVSPSRINAVQALEKTGCDIVISDDGLQHYALERDVEICVFDGKRKWGNACLLPVGPLREPKSRLKSVNYIVVNGGFVDGDSWQHNNLLQSAYRMELQPDDLRSVNGKDVSLVSDFQSKEVNAVAAIGNPERFFKVLEGNGIKVVRHAFNDHHAYQLSDLRFPNSLPIIMTEKDAVKCRQFNLQNAWYLPVSAQLNSDLAGNVIKQLKLENRI